MHLGVEFSSRRADDLNLCIQQSFKRAFIVAFHFKIDVSAVHEQLQPGAGRDRAIHRIRGVNHAVNFHQLAIVFSADQVVEAGLHRIGQRAVPEYRNVVADYIRKKTRFRLSFHQHAIAGNQREILCHLHEDANSIVLHIEIIDIAPVVDNRGFEGDRQPLACLRVGQN